MIIEKMFDDAQKCATKLSNLRKNTRSTIEILERILNLKEGELEVQKWIIENGEILVTFETGCELENGLTEEEKGIVYSINRIFQNPIIEGTLITMSEKKSDPIIFKYPQQYEERNFKKIIPYKLEGTKGKINRLFQ